VRTVYIETYGCQMNVADTEMITGSLLARGYGRVEAPDQADVILVNTCAIRENAETKVFARLRELSVHKRRRPSVRLGVTGCMAQHLRDALKVQAPQVDLLVGPDGYRHLPELLDAEDGALHTALRLDATETYADLPVARDPGVRAWVTIMRGCDRFCTFCIVPYVRGRERSLPLAGLIDEVRGLARTGTKEIVFLGQTVNAYRDGDADFADLLHATQAIDGIERIRFTSPHPSDMSDRVIDAMSACPKVMPQLHLPVQSASDAVLERMARDYTLAQYEALVDRLRTRIPGIAFSTDVIVGFPGETAADFNATYALMERVRYDTAFLFKYSEREGTRAAKWTDDVPDVDKGTRLESLIALQERISGEINRTEVGTDVPVLIEGPARRPEGWVTGKSPQFKRVMAPGPAVAGSIVRVRIEAATSHTLSGRIL
jgi:tRNA-2-methylthio-N6-dimethylallyladenosine synthase